MHAESHPFGYLVAIYFCILENFPSYPCCNWWNSSRKDEVIIKRNKSTNKWTCMINNVYCQKIKLRKILKTWMFLWHTLSNKENVRGYPQSPGNPLYWSLSHCEVFLAFLAISQATKTSILRTGKPVQYIIIYFIHNNQLLKITFWPLILRVHSVKIRGHLLSRI